MRVTRGPADQARSVEETRLAEQPHADEQLAVPKPTARYEVTMPGGVRVHLGVWREHVCQADQAVREARYLHVDTALRYLLDRGYSVRRV